MEFKILPWVTLSFHAPKQGMWAGVRWKSPYRKKVNRLCFGALLTEITLSWPRRSRLEDALRNAETAYKEMEDRCAEIEERFESVTEDLDSAAKDAIAGEIDAFRKELQEIKAEMRGYSPSKLANAVADLRRQVESNNQAAWRAHVEACLASLKEWQDNPPPSFTRYVSEGGAKRTRV